MQRMIRKKKDEKLIKRIASKFNSILESVNIAFSASSIT